MIIMVVHGDDAIMIIMVVHGDVDENSDSGRSSLSKHFKLNPLRAKWLMGEALISGFYSVERMRDLDSPFTGH